MWKNKIYPSILQEKDLCNCRIRKQETLDVGEESRERSIIILPVKWRRKEEEITMKMKQIDTEAEIIFLKKKWIQNMRIRTKQKSCG